MIGPEEVKEFIRSTLAEQAREIKEKCEEMKKKDVVITAYYPDSDTPDPDNSILLKENYGYNKALDSLADYITNTCLKSG